MTQHLHLPGCGELLAQLNAYVDGELDPALCSELEAHLGHCADCRVVLETLTLTVRLYQHLDAEALELAPEIESRLRAALSAARGQPGSDAGAGMTATAGAHES